MREVEKEGGGQREKEGEGGRWRGSKERWRGRGARRGERVRGEWSKESRGR